jgi:hypothetical protein
VLLIEYLADAAADQFNLDTVPSATIQQPVGRPDHRGRDPTGP